MLDQLKYPSLEEGREYSFGEVKQYITDPHVRDMFKIYRFIYSTIPVSEIRKPLLNIHKCYPEYKRFWLNDAKCILREYQRGDYKELTPVIKSSIHNDDTSIFLDGNHRAYVYRRIGFKRIPILTVVSKKRIRAV